MKILHTADWHLGRQFHGRTLETDQSAFLEQIIEAIETHQPDVLIVAGDIFDRASPPENAVRQLNDFLQNVVNQSKTAIVLIAGNHDSGHRIGSLAAVADKKRVLISGPLDLESHPLILHDEHGAVAFSALTFGNVYAARECFGDVSISNLEGVLKAQVLTTRLKIPKGARWVIAAHAFVTNGTRSESERFLSVGDVESVSADIFARAHYVALGHLHRPQSVGSKHICYSGSPLAYSFEEADLEKSMSLIEMDANGDIATLLLSFKPIRKVRTIRGKLSDLLSVTETSEDYIKIILTDLTTQIDAMNQMRPLYPNALNLIYERDARSPETKSLTSAQSELNNPLSVINEFLEYVRDKAPDDVEQKIINEALSQLNQQGIRI